VANMAMLGAFVGLSEIVGFDTLKAMVHEKLGYKEDLLAVNLKAVQAGFELGRGGRKRKARA